MALLSLDDLALDGAAGRFTRDLGEGWTYADRIFGGYTAGLALAAARQTAPHPHAVSAHVAFLDAARPGVLALQVEELRAGRRTWAGRVLASQAGREILTCTAWFGDRGAAPETSPPGTMSPGNGAADVPDPAACPSLEWLAQEWPCVGFLDERGIDYPVGRDEVGGPARVALWARPSKPLGPDPFLAQALDLMLADAHTLDAALRPTGLVATFGVSLDLTVAWERPAPAGDWLRLSAESGPADDGFVACTGTIRARDGALRASVVTSGRMLGPAA